MIFTLVLVDKSVFIMYNGNEDFPIRETSDKERRGWRENLVLQLGGVSFQ